MDKALHYRSWGVHAAWIIDPEGRTAWMISDKFPEEVWLPRSIASLLDWEEQMQAFRSLLAGSVR